MQSTRRVCTPRDDLWGLVVFYDDSSDLSASSDLKGFAASLRLAFLPHFVLSDLLFQQQSNPYCLINCFCVMLTCLCKIIDYNKYMY